MRKILHIDMNSYFATIEQQANPKLRGKPVAVLGSSAKRTIIVAASIEAKRFGVKTGTRIEEAKELCPNIIFVNGEPRKYSWVTKQFIHLFEDYTDKVEIFSIDEAFLDVTQTAKLFEDKKCKTASPSVIPTEAEGSLDKLRDDIENYNDWQGAICIAKEIKKRLREEIGSWISCSIGVSYNKFLAKTGSDLEKPDGLVIITPKNKDEVLLNLPLGEFCGIGSRIEKRLGNLGIIDTKKLRNFPNILLNKEFGIATGEKLKRMAFGMDNSPVKSWREKEAAKSFSCSRTLNRDVVKKNEMKRQILFLLEKVAKKMRDDGYFGQEVGLWLRFKDFSGTGKSMKIGKWTNDSLEMNKIALKILNQLKIFTPVRAIGVYVGRVQLTKNVPQSILKEDKVNEKILAAMDAVNNRFGTDVITRARLSGVKLKEVVSGMGRDKF